MTENARPEEATPVQLTRMEGVLNLVLERIANTTATVATHSEDIGILKSTTQRLSEQAEGAKATAVALALALKEADETRRTRTETAWAPITKLFALLAAVGIVWSIIAPFLNAN